jgi:hypothetical protein
MYDKNDEDREQEDDLRDDATWEEYKGFWS